MKYELKAENPIGVIDSGVGGISVLRELVKILPCENFIFFGDSVHAPYGTKTVEEVRELTARNATALFEEGCKGLVIACNTATSAAARYLREQYPQIPLVGIEPAIKPASNCKEYPTILAMATPMTIREEKFRKLMAGYKDKANIIPLPCPGLMDFVERGDLDGEELRKYLVELFYEFKDIQIDAVVLGCTHYPFVADMIKQVLPGPVQLFDGGEGTAREMKRRLAEAGLLNPSKEAGKVEIRNSLDQKKIELCKKLLEK